MFLRFSLRAISICCLSLIGSIAAAQDMIGTTDNYNQNMNNGALQNRAAATQGYQHSMHHLHQATSGIPNAALMAAAIAEARQAFSADNQAQELARAALQGTQSANTQVDQLGTQSGNQLDLQALQNIANNQSELAAEAQQAFAAYGVSLGTDQTTLTTPTGVTNMTINNGQAGNTKSLLNADGTSSLSSTTGASGSSSSAFGSSLLAPNGLNDPNAARNLKNATPASGLATDAKAISLTPIAAANAVTGSKDNRAEELKKNLERNRAMVLKQMGRPEETEEEREQAGPIRAKQEDIFQAVHSHYQTLRDQSTFFEATLPADASPQVPDELPKFSRGL